MNKELKKWIEKIAAILAKADSTTSPEEESAFRAAAERLMQKYGITADSISDDEMRAAKFDSGLKRMPAWRAILADACALLFGVLYVYGHRLDRTGDAPREYVADIFVGPDHATEQARYLLAVLTRKMNESLEEYCEGGRIPRRSRNSFRVGFAEGVHDKIELMARSKGSGEHGDVGSTALVFLKNSQALRNRALAWYRAQGKRISYSNRGDIADHWAAIAGGRAGKSASWSRGVERDSSSHPKRLNA